MSRAVARLVLAAVAVVFVAAGVTSAQTTTETKTFEVIARSGKRSWSSSSLRGPSESDRT